MAAKKTGKVPVALRGTSKKAATTSGKKTSLRMKRASVKTSGRKR